MEGCRRPSDVWAPTAVILLGVASSACFAPAAPRELAVPFESSGTTVLVENVGIEAVAIYSSRRAARLGTLMPGQRVCLRLPNSFAQQLLARPVSGGGAMLSPRVDLSPGDGWEWSIGINTVADRLSLMPRTQCHPD